MVELMLAGADPKKRNLSGNSPLDDAKREGHVGIVMFLEAFNGIFDKDVMVVVEKPNRNVDEIDLKIILKTNSPGQSSAGILSHSLH